ncbi:hypothetical protein MTO96_045559 [Rhipicephalus appendiculatus]
MDRMRCIFTAFFITCGLLHNVYAFDTAQWQCHRQTLHGKVTTCAYPCVTHSTTAGQHVFFVTEDDGTPCMNGYCFSGLCAAEENHHSLKRKKRSLKSFIAGFVAGRRWGLWRGRRPSLFQRIGRR